MLGKSETVFCFCDLGETISFDAASTACLVRLVDSIARPESREPPTLEHLRAGSNYHDAGTWSHRLLMGEMVREF